MGGGKECTHTVTLRDPVQTHIPLATERLPTWDTVTGSDTHLGKMTQQRLSHRHSGRTDSGARLKCCQTHKAINRPEARRQGVCDKDKSTWCRGKMDILAISTERQSGEHQAWMIQWHPHIHAETNVTGQKHTGQTHTGLCIRHKQAMHACSQTGREG